MIVILLLSLSYFISVSVFVMPIIKTTVNDLQEVNDRTVLSEIVDTYKHVYYEIKDFKKSALDIEKNNLKSISYLADSILQDSYKNYKEGKISEKEAKKQAFKKIINLKYGNGGYFFVFSDDYKLLAHPNLQILQCNNKLNIKDKNGKYFVKEMIDKARKDGEGFTEYYWDATSTNEFEKLSYVKKFKPWNIYFGTGTYIDNINLAVKKKEQKLLADLHTKISNLKIGETGYIYIFNSKFEMLLHPDSRMEGLNLKKIKNPTKNTFLVDDLIDAYKKDKKLYYRWNKLNDKTHYIYNKLSFIEYIPEFDWYIISSSYLDEFDRNSNKLKKTIEVIGFVLMGILILIASVFFYKLEKEINGKTQELIKMQEKLKELVNIDQLTGLYNRRYFYDSVGKIISLAKRQNKELSILMIDVDNFKNINDTYGHAVGDKVLKIISSVISKSSRQSDIVARIGGEEFVVLLTNTSVGDAFKVANKMRKNVENQQMEIDKDLIINFTISIGISNINIKEETQINEALLRADLSLYKAKEDGKNKVYSQTI